MNITEYRGIEGLVYAKIIKDDDTGYETGDVKSLAGVATLSRETSSESEAHYYNNVPAVIVSSTSSDVVTIGVSAIPLDVLADVTSQKYIESLGAMLEGERGSEYYAIGYITKKTDGTQVYVWRYKGQFSIPNSEHNTEDDSTDANGQEIVFTGISTTYKFPTYGRCKAINVEEGKADLSTFFDTVTTPEDLETKKL